MIEGLLHIGIYTNDLNQSIYFYCQNLGFEMTWKGIVQHHTGDLPVATVKVGSCVIELVQPADPTRVTRVDGSVQHVALRVLDLETFTSDLEKKGVLLDENISEINYEGGIRHCFIRGPSNERIELGEYVN